MTESHIKIIWTDYMSKTRMMYFDKADQIADSEMLIGKLYLRDQSLRQKYEMSLEELNEALGSLENLPNYEEAKIRGIPVLEAVADTRSWEHVIERLIGEEKKLQELLSLQKASKSQWITAEGSKYG
jgi:hypothetical protein